MKYLQRLDGFSEMRKLFAEYPQDARIAGRIAMSKAVEPALQDAKANAPVDTGLLRSEIVKGQISSRDRKRFRMSAGGYAIFIKGRTKKYTGNKRNSRAGRVGKNYVVDGPAFYGKWQEFGYTGRDGRKVPGRFYMTRAFENNTQAMLQLIVANFRPNFEKAVQRRAARQAARLKGSRR